MLAEHRLVLLVSGGAGHLLVPTAGGSTWALLNSVSETDVAMQVGLSLDAMPTGGGTFAYVLSRQAGNNDYRAQVRFAADGRVQLMLVRRAAGVETTLQAMTLPGVTYTPGAVVQVRMDTSGIGSTTLRAKAWLQGAEEPADWQLTATDDTGVLQVPGAIGVAAYVSGAATATPVTLSLDDLWAGPAGTRRED